MLLRSVALQATQLDQDRNTVITLLRDLNESPNAAERVKALEKVQEIIVQRQADTLLREVAPFLIQLRSERTIGVRKFVIGFVEQACNTKPELIPTLFPALADLAADDRTSVSKALVPTLAKVVPPAMALIADGAPGGADLWSAIQGVRKTVAALVASKNEGVRSTVIRFLELLVVLFTPPATPHEGAPAESLGNFTTRLVPPNHAVLSPPVLNACALEVLDQLLAAFQVKLSVTNRVVLLTALGSVCRQRSQHGDRVMPVLLSLQSKPDSMGLSASAWTQVFRSLKSVFTSLCEQRALAPHWRVMSDALRRMGFGADADKVAARLQQLGPVAAPSVVVDGGAAPPTASARAPSSNAEEVDMDVDSSDSDSDAETPVPSKQRPPKPAPRPSSRSSSSSSRRSSSRSSAAAAAAAPAATSSFQYKPRRKRRSTAPGTAGALAPPTRAPAQQPQPAAPAPMDPQRKQELAMLLRLPTPLVVRLAVRCVAKFQNAPLPTDGSASMMSSPAVINLLSQLDALKLSIPQPEGSAEGHAAEEKKDGSALSRRMVPKIKAPEMKAEMAQHMAQRAFMRLVSKVNERSISREGRQELHHTIVAKLVTTGIATRANRAELLKYIISDFVNRYDVALLWLYSVLARNTKANYEDLLASFLKLMKEKPETDKVFTKFLTEVPSLSYQAEMVLRQYCETENRSELGLETLKEIIFLRPEDQMQALDHLLERGCDPNSRTRSSAVRWLVSDVSQKAEGLRGYVVTRAVEFLRKVLESHSGSRPEEAEEDFVEKEVKRLDEKLDKEDKAFEAALKKKIAAQLKQEEGMKDKMPKKEKVDGADEDGDVAMDDTAVKAERGAEGITKSDVKTKTKKEEGDASFEKKLHALLEKQMVSRHSSRKLKLAACREHALFRRNRVVEEIKAKEPEQLSKHVVRHVALFLALSVYQPDLLRHLLEVYVEANDEVKAAIRNENSVGELIGVLGMDNKGLLSVIRACPKGAEDLVVLFLDVLTRTPEGEEAAPLPTPELVKAVKRLFTERIQDARLFLPIMSGLSEDDIFQYLPQLVRLQHARFAVDKIFARRPPAISPQNFLIALHDLCPTKHSKNLEQVKNLINYCTQQKKKVFNSEVLAIVLQRLLDQTPVPVLFMRTVLQTLKSYSRLKSFIMNVLQRLISKRVYEQPDLWQGFIKCCNVTAPQCFPVLLALPVKQLQEVLKACPKLVNRFKNHATRVAGVRDEVLELLGLKSKAGQAPLGDVEVIESKTTEPRSAVLKRKKTPSSSSSRDSRDSRDSRGSRKRDGRGSSSVSSSSSSSRRRSGAAPSVSVDGLSSRSRDHRMPSVRGGLGQLPPREEDTVPQASRNSDTNEGGVDGQASKRRRIGESVDVTKPERENAAANDGEKENANGAATSRSSSSTADKDRRSDSPADLATSADEPKPSGSALNPPPSEQSSHQQTQSPPAVQIQKQETEQESSSNSSSALSPPPAATPMDEGAQGEGGISLFSSAALFGQSVSAASDTPTTDEDPYAVATPSANVSGGGDDTPMTDAAEGREFAVPTSPSQFDTSAAASEPVNSEAPAGETPVDEDATMTDAEPAAEGTSASEQLNLSSVSSEPTVQQEPMSPFVAAEPDNESALSATSTQDTDADAASAESSESGAAAAQKGKTAKSKAKTTKGRKKRPAAKPTRPRSKRLAAKK